MLARLAISNIVLIDRMEIEPRSGLNVFTGQTGAGKSILLDALALALGSRADAGLVRHGADSASVAAEFALPAGHPALALLSEHGIETQGGTLVLRRTLAKDGKSRAFANDAPIGLALAKELGGLVGEIHGQFASHALLDPAAHIGLLDAYGGLGAQKAETSKTYRELQSVLAELDAARRASAAAEAEREFWETSAAQLRKLAPAAGEEDELLRAKKIMANGQRLSELLADAARIIDDKILPESVRAARVLEKADALLEGAWGDLLPAFDAAAESLHEISHRVNRTLGGLDFDPRRAEENDDRLYALREQARKHRTTVDELPNILTELENKLASAERGAADEARLEACARAAAGAFRAAAEKLTAGRRKAAEKLDKGVARELAPLKLAGAKFATEITPLPSESWGASGAEKAVFTAATNAGQPFGSIAKIASGGELARFMLAIKVNLLAASPVVATVFDEVDTGIGGATASAVGQRLVRLAEGGQVLVITHSPQVAAAGAHHWLVEKDSGLTTVRALAADERREEIARMLSGAATTPEARAAAARLLAQD
ncbi:DNA repair protein RecN [Alphaproteobacteria bacterium]|nr:DNA repair protein RecN [Alphaproteobacteria bacterium]